MSSGPAPRRYRARSCILLCRRARAVSLVTKAFDEIKGDSQIGRAEALRRSMLALIGAGGRNAHPATWAPFVAVGEGAR